jgi:type II secretion system protein N
MIAWSKGLGYLLFSCIAFLFFFYMTFPFDLVQKKMVQAFDSSTACKTEVERQEASFPFRLAWHQLRLLCPMGPPFVIASIKTDLAVLPALFNKRGEVDFRIEMPSLSEEVSPSKDSAPGAFPKKGGAIVGHLTVHQTENDLAFSLKQEGMMLDLRPMGISGELNMRAEGSWVGDDILNGKGAFYFAMNNVRVDPQESSWPMDDLAGLATLAGISALSFSTIQGSIDWQQNKISIGTFQAQGDSAVLSGTGGEIQVRQPFEKSVISLACTIAPKGRLQQVAALFLPGYSEQRPFTLDVRGPLDSPSILINGQKLPIFS